MILDIMEVQVEQVRMLIFSSMVGFGYSSTAIPQVLKEEFQIRIESIVI